MLHIAGDLRLRDRGTADYLGSDLPLLDLVIRTFGYRLQRELLRGADAAYVHQENNLFHFRGRLAITEHIRHNAAHRERFYCRFDEFLPDTTINRVFKAACRRLLRVSQRPATQEPLRHCLMLLDEVKDVVVGTEVFETTSFTRQNGRFEDLFLFCRWVIEGEAPSFRAGEQTSFSLLFNMNTVFEKFIAEFVRTRVGPRHNWEVIPQARGRSKWLMRNPQRPRVACGSIQTY